MHISCIVQSEVERSFVHTTTLTHNNHNGHIQWYTTRLAAPHKCPTHATGASIYVTVFAKRDHLGANLDFEFCIWSECALLPLYSTLYCASVAGSVSEIYLRKVWNYEKYVVEKTTIKHLLPVKPQHSVFFRVMEYSVIIGLGRPSSLATYRFTGLSERPPKVIILT